MKHDDRNHIDWVDGAKGIAIVCVILEHCLPQQDKIYAAMHIGQAVPIFIFITSYLISTHYHSLKEYFTTTHLKKMLHSVLPPFLMVLFCEVIVYLYHYGEIFSIKSVLIAGGCYGPGSYYLYIYLSLWFLIPFVIELVRHTPLWLSFIIVLTISIGSEYLFTLIEDSRMEKLWRILPIRYFMIVWIGCSYSKLNEIGKKILVFPAVISEIIIVITMYLSNIQYVTPPETQGLLNLRIVPPYWDAYHWYTAFYCYLFIPILQRIRYSETLLWLGKHSWLIFCWQMFAFWSCKL